MIAEPSPESLQEDGFGFVQESLTSENFIKTPLIYSV